MKEASVSQADIFNSVIFLVSSRAMLKRLLQTQIPSHCDDFCPTEWEILECTSHCE